MDGEIETYRRQIGSLLERVCRCLEGLSEAQLNWRPPIDGANSAYTIASHVLGNARAWVLGIACGRPVERDRPAEFRARGGDASALLAERRRLAAEIEASLAKLTPASLGRRLVPDQSLWGATEAQEVSVRQVLIEVVEHASLHLGQLQITRDLALQGVAT